MKSRGLASTALFCLVLAGACGDDRAVSKEDGAIDDGAVADLGQDTAIDDGAVDLAVDSVTLPDGPLGQKCRDAIPIPLQAGYGKGFGQILASDQSNEIDLTSASCTTSATPGAERLHSVQLEAGKTYSIQVAPEIYGPMQSFEAAAYVFTSCADVAGSCLAGGFMTPMKWDAGGMPPPPPLLDAGSGTNTYAVTMSVTAQVTGLHYIGVDSAKPAGTDGSYGSYTVTVTEAPSNDSCSAAEPMTWTGSKATATGVLTAGSSTVDLVDGPVCKLGPVPGPDLFYEIDLTAGKTYRASVPNIGAALYVFANCADVAGSCIAGTQMGDMLVFSPTATGKYLIGVDMPYTFPPPQPTIKFTLTVEEVTPPTNDSCTKAEPMTWSAGTATATGDLTLATNQLDLGPAGCTGEPTSGPDLFYELSLTAGKSYRVSIDPMMPVSIYVLTDCANPGSCVAGTSGMKAPPILTFTAKQNGKHVIGLDVDPQYTKGGMPLTFTLKVEEFVPPPNDSCSTPTTMSWVAGKATATVDLTNASNTLDLGAQSCVGPTEGPDLFYEVALTGGKAYSVTLTTDPMTKPPPALYVLSSCAAGASGCIAGAGMVGMPTTKISFIAPSSASYIIGVDYNYPFFPGQPMPGPMTLEVVEFTPAANSTCGTPQALSFSGTEAVVQGDTGTALNDISGVQCSNSMPFNGPQLYYSIQLTANKEYLLLLETDPVAYFDGVIYAFPASTACNATAINPACYNTSSNNMMPGPRHVIVKPTVTEDWVVVVDSYTSQTGSFTLKIQELTIPSNDTCAGAELLAFPSGQSILAVAGQTLKATSTVDLTATDCTNQTTSGPDVFYQLPVKANHSYELMLMPGSMQIDLAFYLFTSCTNVAGTCGPGMGADQNPIGAPEQLTYKATSDQTIYIGVDGRGVSDLGLFSLQITEKGPPPANDTCAAATKLNWSGTPISIQVDTTSATNTIDLGPTSCTKDYTAGTDLFYEITLPAGSYTITLTPTGTLDPALYILSSCSTSACITGSDIVSPGAAETVTLAPTSQTTYIIGVDAWDPNEAGVYTLEIK